ncbi:hypothetical protein DCC81_00645 [Chitinophaga parva]|uniref:Alpha-2-macroglobulin domain-containing protein n=1 Tax=Chitinophaga parva TaxID=2169414 RepID=A0A2T7BK24_9BACT|nr:alpha-2-macroglobulin family protein [Chitinophaga parva]PUZ28026.1 hypothetical protein DCC81_00645 [Chitinophaga parva]
MRCISLLLLCLCFLTAVHGQSVNYDSLWRNVDSSEKHQLPQTALEQVNGIYAVAQRSGQPAQAVRALLYRVHLEGLLQLKGTQQDQETLLAAYDTATGPTRAVLALALAEFYLQKANYRSYRPAGDVTGDTSTNIATWSYRRLQKEVTAWQDKALAPAALLAQLPSASWRAMVVKGNVHSNPTLYDLILDRVLVQRMDMRARGMQWLDDNPYFASAAAFAAVQTFVQQPLPADTNGALRDVAALQFQLHNLLQRKDTAALLLADLQRVSYMHWAAGVKQPGADSSYYLPALQRMRAYYTGQEEEGAILCAMAQYYFAKDSLVLPKLLCDMAIALHPNAVSNADIKAMQSLITRPGFHLQTAAVSLPDRPILASAAYRNLHRVYCLLARDNDSLDRRMSDQNRQYLRGHSFRQWAQDLPDPGDFKEHRTEIKINALPPGRYVMLVSDTATFQSDAVSQLHFTVSGIAYLDQGNDCWLMDRQSGEPLAGMKVIVEGNDDDSIYFTDSEGHLKLKSGKEATSPDLTCIRGKDTLRITADVPAGYVADSRDEEEEPRMTYFTDRAVYRPGQPIYFKGIASNDAKTKVVAGYKDVIFLYNEEGDEMDSLAVKSNRYGSFSGVFKIPATAVPGRYNLSADNAIGDLDIEVAAYKRPRFEVKLDTVNHQYRLYDTVSIAGTAKAFAGFNLDQAKVRYHITSSPAGNWRWGGTPEGGHQVVEDSTSTDAGGHFLLRFPAVPDKKDTAAVFFVNVTVTDANGESHDAKLQLSLFRAYLHLELQVSDVMTAAALHQLTAVARNAGGRAVETPMNVTLYRVNTLPGAKRKRLWDAPDQYVMNRSTFEKDFPLDPYDDAGAEPHWPTGEKIWGQTVQSGHEKPFGLPVSNLPSGRYELCVQVYDTLHNLVERRDRFTYVNAVSGKAPFPTPLLVTGTGEQWVAGGAVSLNVCTDADTLYGIQTILTGKAGDARPSTKREIILLTKGVNHLTLQMPAEGQLTWDLATWHDGRLYHVIKHYVLQAQTGPDLRLEAHRDRLLPGEKTQWTLSLPAGTSAETMAWMYDASLDDIARLQPNVFYPAQSSFSVYWRNLWNNTRSSDDYDWYREPRFALMKPDALRLLEPVPEDGITEFMDQSAPMTMVESAAPGVAIYGTRAVSKMSLAGSLSDVVVVGYSTIRSVENPSNAALSQPPVTPRRNFAETAFFYPVLYPDAHGKMTLHFEMPESLTRWQFYSIAHDRNMRMTLLGDQVVTQQPLMVMPNAPRFLRAGDSLELPVKIISMTDKALTGNVQLALHDAATGAPLDAAFGNNGPSSSFTLSPGSSVTQAFRLQVPAHFSGALQYTVTARGGGFTDGEENTIPVLSKTILITSTLPLPVSGDGTHTFTLPALLHSDTAAMLQQHSLKLEYTANPAWNAVQALPFLMEYPYECAEQTFNRYYANALAGYLVSSMPRLQEVFKQWARNGSTTLTSTLSKNEDLKNALLAETPWVLDAAGDAARKQHVGLLFDLYKLGVEKSNAKARLAYMQLGNGAFPWFSGGVEDRYITQYVVAGMGRLQKLSLSGATDGTMQQVIKQALLYLDKRIAKDSGYAALNIHYLYARSFFPGVPIDSAARPRIAQLMGTVAQHWTQYSSYEQAMLAVTLYRHHDEAKARQIMASLKENGIRDGEQGTYWKDMQPGYHWQQGPIEAAAQMLEAFNEITQDTVMVNGIKTWLLRNKQVQGWSNSKATADACYALLLQGGNWLAGSPTVHITVGGEAAAPTSTDAGTGYISQQWNVAAIRPAMGEVTITTSGTHGQPSWGALYWQYFQDMDHVQRAQTNLQLQKQLYITNSETLLPVTAAHPVKVGDKITVRLTITTDRDMDYVQLKDLRAAGLEPVETLSGYQYDAGLSYYRATLDVSTSFFFSRLPQGTHVLEYQVYATHVGDFANGITTLQCMYAPEFSAHSGGQRIVIAQ